LYSQGLRRAARTPYPLLAVTLAPLVTLWLLCQLFGALPQALRAFPTHGYLDFVAPAMAVASGLPFAVWEGMSVGRDADSRFLDQLLAASGSRAFIPLGALFAGATGAVFSALLVCAVSLAAGTAIAGGIRGLFALAGLAGVLGLIYAGLAWIITALVPNRRVAGAILVVGLVSTLLLTDLLLPNGLLPAWLRLAANLNSLTAAIDGARAVSWPRVDWGRWERNILVLLAVGLVTTGGAAALSRPLRGDR
jgi:ABC-type multidrug transport system permease subunit